MHVNLFNFDSVWLLNLKNQILYQLKRLKKWKDNLMTEHKICQGKEHQYERKQKWRDYSIDKAQQEV